MGGEMLLHRKDVRIAETDLTLEIINMRCETQFDVLFKHLVLRYLHGIIPPVVENMKCDFFQRKMFYLLCSKRRRKEGFLPS